MKTKQLLHRFLLFHLLLLLSLSMKAQNTTIKGIVSDDKGQALPGVAIMIKGTSQGTNSNSDGSYSITASHSDVLVFSMVGFTIKEIAIKNQSEINVQLKNDERNLNEIVVIGYGTQKRRDLTGSVGSVKGDVFKDQPITNPVSALQGRVAGVDIVQNSGAPDASPTVIIRGLSSLNQPNPLYIVDGIRTPDANNINMQDIASIDVLKDASSAAIYGAAAAGGVIVITTKKGKTGPPSIHFSARYGITRPKLIKLLDKNGFIKLSNSINPTNFQNADGTPKSGLDTLANTDWSKALYKGAYEQNYNLSVAGATPSLNYLFSGFFNDQKGIYINNYSKIGGARINTDYQISKSIKIGEQLAISQRKTSPPVGSEAQLHNAPFRTLPIIPIVDKLGQFGVVPQGYGGISQFGGSNPVGTANFANAENYKNNLQANVYADIKLPLDLSFRTNFSYNYYLENQDLFQNSYTIGKISLGSNSLRKYFVQSSQFLSNYVLTYNHNFGKHNLNIIAGAEQIVNKYNNLDGTESSIGLPGYSFIQTSNSNLFLAGKNDQNSLIKSFFGRVNYNWNNRYYLSASIRQDGNSLSFGHDKLRGIFPAASAGWNISEEPFFKNSIPGISLLKFRGSYGELGNSNIGPYQFNSSVVQFQSSGGLASGAQNFSPGGPFTIANSANGIANSAVHWETVKEANIGLDGEALNSNLYFSAEYYNKNTVDMLYNIQLPLSTGLTSKYIDNIGKVNSKGIDLLLGYRNTAGKFGYDISFTAGFNRNKVLSLSGLATDAIYDGYNYYSTGDAGFNATPNQTITVTKAGLPFGSFYGYKSLGIFKTDAEAAKQSVNGVTAHAGDLIFEDLNKDGKINDADKQVIGNPNPKLVYGFNIHLNYQGFDVAMLFNGVMGVQLYNGVKAYTQFPFADGNTTSDVFNDSFLGSNGLTSQPRLGIVQNGAMVLDKNQNYSSVNSYFVENGSYLKLKNLQIGYSFSSRALEHVKIKNARLFVMANNVFTITKYTGLDPELGSSSSALGYNTGITTRGIDAVSQYPQTRIYSLGLDITF